jgi:hypothetical protein
MSKAAHTDLASAMAKSGGGTRTKAEQPAPTPAHPKTSQPGRAGLKPLTFQVPPEVHKQLKIMGAELDKNGHKMFFEMCNDYFAKHGKPEICPTTADE